MRKAPEHRVRESRIARDVVREHRAPLLPERQEEALLLEGQRHRGQRLHVFAGHVVRRGRHQPAAAEILQVDGRGVRTEQADQLPANPPKRLADVEGGADRGRDRGQRLALAEPLG